MEREEKKEQKKQNKLTVCSINRVEGFNPEAEAQEMLQAGKDKEGKVKSFLPLPAKKQWFRLAMPDGKITCTETYPALPPEMSFKEKKEIYHEVEYVSVIARVYKNKNDDPEAYLGEGYGVVYANDSAFDKLTPERKYPEMLKMARGNAESRAFYNAGFGLQFYGDDVELIDEIALEPDQVPVPKQPTVHAKGPSLEIKDEDVNFINSFGSENGFIPEETEKVEPANQEKKGRRTYQQIYEDSVAELENLFSKVCETKNSIDTALTDIEKVSAENRMEKLQTAWEKTVSAMQKAVEKGAKAESGVILNLQERLSNSIEEKAEDTETSGNLDIPKEEPKEETTSQMTVFMPSADEAKTVTCSFGTYSGRTYGEIYNHQKNMLVWLYHKELPEAEKQAVETLCMNDTELKAKLERQ